VQQKQLSIVFAGGGTGGHLFPAIAIADEIKRTRPEAEITFIGTQHKIEAKVVPQHGYGFETIWVSGLRRRLSLENILFPVKFVVALVQSLFLIRRLNPDVVVGTGGYVCGPPLFVASLLGIPTLIQEQNSYPGITTRLMASRANEVHLSFNHSQRYLRRTDNVHISGNPTRAGVGKISRDAGAEYLGLRSGKLTLLVFGGSLGASSINDAVLGILPQLVAKGIQIVWQTGESDYQRIESEASRLANTSGGIVKVHKFIDKMEYAYAACDLAVCRAGATTVAELSKAGVPSVLIPYPYAAADHQTENARAMVEAGAAVMIKDADLRVELLSAVQKLIADRDRLQRMQEHARRVGNADAASIIARAALNLANAKHGRA
jgi:UDP-N-acetylglucosamine--N-acetylmuramyl-(pentapeptide) pyrophosphoryl-undecaprenol N-acetylglucosamine transferase